MKCWARCALRLAPILAWSSSSAFGAKWFVAAPSAWIRSAAADHAAGLQELPIGAEVEVPSCEGALWCPAVLPDGRKGWVRRDAVRADPPTAAELCAAGRVRLAQRRFEPARLALEAALARGARERVCFEALAELHAERKDALAEAAIRAKLRGLDRWLLAAWCDEKRKVRLELGEAGVYSLSRDGKVVARGKYESRAGSIALATAASELRVAVELRGHGRVLVSPEGEVLEPRFCQAGAAAPVAPPASSGDAEEKIDLGPAPPVAPAATTSTAPGSEHRFQATGFARSLTSVQAGPRGLQSEAPLPGVLPYDRLVNREQLLLNLRYARGKSFEVAVSGLLQVNGFETETSSPGASFNGFNGADLRYGFEPQLREAYVGLFAGPLDLRFGQQRVAWGKGDIFAPNDVVNPRDLRDPFLNETELLRIPVLLARADLDLAKVASLQLLFAPFFVPDRLLLAGDNWALVQPGAPNAFRQLLFWSGASQDPVVRGAAGYLNANFGQRAPSFEDASAGARLSYTVGGVDIAHYYHYGFATLPNLQLDPKLAQALFSTDFRQIRDLQSFEAKFSPIIASSRIDISYPRRHHVGLDIGTTVGSFAIRFDAGYDSARVFYDINLAAVVRDVVETVVAFEYQTGDIGKTVLVEILYRRILGSDTARPLLFYDRDSVAMSLLVRWTFLEWLELELRAIFGATPVSLELRPQIGYKREGWSFGVGGLFLGGDTYSLGDYFSRNGSVYLYLKRAF
jgi:hypothetical protein